MSVIGSQISSITALRNVQIFCMNVPYYKGEKGTRLFSRKIHLFMKTSFGHFWVFLWRNVAPVPLMLYIQIDTNGYYNHTEKMSKIGSAVLQI